MRYMGSAESQRGTPGYPHMGVGMERGLQPGMEEGNWVTSGEDPAKWAELIKRGIAVNILEGVTLMREMHLGI